MSYLQLLHSSEHDPPRVRSFVIGLISLRWMEPTGLLGGNTIAILMDELPQIVMDACERIQCPII